MTIHMLVFRHHLPKIKDSNQEHRYFDSVGPGEALATGRNYTIQRMKPVHLVERFALFEKSKSLAF